MTFLRQLRQNGNQALVMIIAKMRFNIYLFTFVVAIYSTSRDIKLTFATETISDLVA